jgi:hypothetical protein
LAAKLCTWRYPLAFQVFAGRNDGKITGEDTGESTFPPKEVLLQVFGIQSCRRHCRADSSTRFYRHMWSNAKIRVTVLVRGYINTRVTGYGICGYRFLGSNNSKDLIYDFLSFYKDNMSHAGVTTRPYPLASGLVLW